MSRRLTYQHILVATAIIFLILPFVITFNELLTKIAENLRLYIHIQKMIVPTLTKMAGAILKFFGVQTAIYGGTMYLQGGGHPLLVYISWNCIGWQSQILFAFAIVTVIQGSYTMGSKIACLIIGILGTILINVGRIALVCLIALYWGQLPAKIFHDHGGTILILTWLLFYWHFSSNYVLRPCARKAPRWRESNLTRSPRRGDHTPNSRGTSRSTGHNTSSP